MWYSYKVEECFDEAVKGVCDTLVRHCEKDTRIEAPLGPKHPAWFMAERGSTETPGGYAVKARGYSTITKMQAGSF